MPLKHHDPFASRAERLDATVNPYVALLRDGAASGDLPVAFGEGLKTFPGNWRGRLAEFHGLERAPEQLVVEIGCHKGHTLLAMAKANPHVGFIGIDITFKRVVTTAQRAEAQGLKNVYCAMANATNIDRLFNTGEIDGCLIFFPDPWVKKKRQLKNRLVSPEFSQRLSQAVARGGFCWLKTDQLGYFDEAAASLRSAGFADFDEPPTGVIATDYTSTFEQRFHEQNLPTFGVKLVRQSADFGAAHRVV